MKQTTSDILLAVRSAVLSAILTGGISYALLRKQLNETSEMAQIDRDANMAYTRYQCEWQRIRIIKEDASAVILLHDLQTFNNWADDIKAVNKNVNNEINSYVQNLNKALTHFRIALSNKQADKEFYDQIIKYYQPYIDVIYDVLSYIHYIDYEESAFIEEIERLCSSEFKKYYNAEINKQKYLNEAISHRVIIVEYLYSKAQDKDMHTNLIKIRNSLTEYIYNLEEENNKNLQYSNKM